jgi:hypothetical protein
MKIRYEKSKPKLCDIIKVYGHFKDKGKGPEGKKFMIEKLKMLYSGGTPSSIGEDQKYTKISSTFARVFRVLRLQGTTLTNMNDRLNILQKRKDERTADPINFRSLQKEKRDFLETKKIKEDVDQYLLQKN